MGDNQALKGVVNAALRQSGRREQQLDAEKLEEEVCITPLSLSILTQPSEVGTAAPKPVRRQRLWRGKAKVTP